MSYGYIGDTSTSIKQQVKNAGVLSVSDVLDLEGKGHLGGSLHHIETQTLDGGSASTIDFVNLANNPFDVYYVKFNNITTDAQIQISFRFSDDNGSTFEEGSTDYEYAGYRMHTSGQANFPKDTGHSSIRTDAYTSSTGLYNGQVWLYNLLDSNTMSFLNWHSISHLGGAMRANFGGGNYNVTGTINGFRFNAGSATILTGTAKLYGVKQT